MQHTELTRLLLSVKYIGDSRAAGCCRHAALSLTWRMDQRARMGMHLLSCRKTPIYSN